LILPMLNQSLQWLPHSWPLLLSYVKKDNWL
jgi:hypothetical protein